MAQPIIRAFIEDLARVVDLPDPIVEFGSLQVEPEDQDGDLRPLFPGRPFKGVDFRPGLGVDEVADLRELPMADGSVGTAICVDTLEHCEDPVQACRELTRVTADGGVCIVSSVMLFGIHAYPSDYFRFTPEAFRSMLGGFDDVWVHGQGHPDAPHEVIGVAAKGRALGLRLDMLPSLATAQAEYDAHRGAVRIGVFNYKPRDLLLPLARQAPRLVRERLGR
jgi:SAM-dependent methyltransferase